MMNVMEILDQYEEHSNVIDQDEHELYVHDLIIEYVLY